MKTLFAGLIVLFTMSGCVSIPKEYFDSGRIAIGTTQTQLRSTASTPSHVEHYVPVSPASQAAYDKEIDKIAKSMQNRSDCMARNKARTDHGLAPRYRCGANGATPIVRWTRSGNTHRQQRYRSAYRTESHRKHDRKHH